MRLTLRTMLAYIDGILDPNDAQEIGKKVADSDFATSLVHRIGDVIRRLRLGAPNVADTGATSNPNTVAEYLDNTLGGDQVTDFEKTCLESDVHLAEVAACHQILTLVLGEPAEISPASRQWMYQLQHTQAELQQSASGGDARSRVATDVQTVFNRSDFQEEPILVGASVDGVGAKRTPHPKPTVPEYLRESKKNRQASPVAAALLLLICLAAAALYFTHQLEPGTPLGDALVRFGLIQSQPHAVAIKTPDNRPDSGEASGNASEPEKSPESGLTETPAAEVSDAADSATAANPPALPLNGSDAAGFPATVPQQPSSIIPNAAQPSSPEAERPEPAVAMPGVLPSATPAGDATPAPAPLPNAASANASPAESLASLTPAPGPTVPEVPERASGAKATEPPAEIEPLAKLVSPDQVLLKDATKEGWVRAAADQMLISEPLLALPTYRPKMVLAGGVTLEALGGAQLRLLRDDAQDVRLGVHILFGRIVLKAPAQVGKQIRIQVGDHWGMLSFDDANSLAAVAVRRIHMPGENPETEPVQLAAEWFTTTGKVSWREGGNLEAIPLPPMSQMKHDMQGTSEPSPAKEIPIWITAEPLNSWDGMASPTLAQSLQPDRAVRVGLMEMVDSHAQRQKEIRWLALRCLGYIGEFQGIVAALNDSTSKRVWPEYVDYLRASVARDPDSAKAVRVALETQYPDDAGLLYRMLWGYTNHGLENGEDKDLVDQLGNDQSLPARVLANWNLMDITGLGGALYKPEDTAAKRKQGFTAWKTRLNAKQIRFKSPTDKKPAAARDKATKAPAAPAEF